MIAITTSNSISVNPRDVFRRIVEALRKRDNARTERSGIVGPLRSRTSRSSRGGFRRRPARGGTDGPEDLRLARFVAVSGKDARDRGEPSRRRGGSRSPVAGVGGAATERLMRASGFRRVVEPGDEPGGEPRRFRPRTEPRRRGRRRRRDRHQRGHPADRPRRGRRGQVGIPARGRPGARGLGRLRGGRSFRLRRYLGGRVCVRGAAARSPLATLGAVQWWPDFAVHRGPRRGRPGQRHHDGRRRQEASGEGRGSEGRGSRAQGPGHLAGVGRDSVGLLARRTGRAGIPPPASRRRPCWWDARPPSRAGAGFRAGLG